MERFLARRGSSVVGRVAAIVDPAFGARWAPNAGFFGFFESIDDVAVGQALLRQAESALRERGVRQVFGPVNLTLHDEVGFLVDGFDTRPMLLSPFNPPRYAELATSAGYAPATEYHSYGWDFSRTMSPAAQRIVRRLSHGSVRIRRSDPKRWIEEGHALLDTYNAAFTDVWGFVPLTWEEYLSRANEFRQFYRPELAQFAEVDGRIVGFGLALPDINEALQAVDGRLLPFGWLRLMRAVPRIRSARFILLGVLPDFVGRGIAPLLAHGIAEAAREAGIRFAELSLVDASNERVRHVIGAFGGRPVKTFRLFHKAI